MLRIRLLPILLTIAISMGCSDEASDDAASSESAVQATIALGTYLIDERPRSDKSYLSRLTLLPNGRFEADFASPSGAERIAAGKYSIVGHVAAFHDAPIENPRLRLEGFPGPSGLYHFRNLPDGGLRIWDDFAEYPFTMKSAPNWQPAPTTTKVIACQNAEFDAKLTLDRAQNRLGTLVVTHRPGAAIVNPPAGSIQMIRYGRGPNSTLYKGDWRVGFGFNIINTDLDRGTGSALVQFTYDPGVFEDVVVPVTCAFVP